MSKFGQTDLERLAHGDEKAFKSLFNRFYLKLVQYAVSYTQDIDIAEDMAQETFTRLWHNRASLSNADNLEGYLMTSVRNRCLNYLDRKKTTDRYMRNYVYDELENDESDRESLAAEMRRLFDELPEKRREVMRLNVFEAKSYVEIAQTMDISLNTVKDHVKKAYAFLRRQAGTRMP